MKKNREELFIEELKTQVEFALLSVEGVNKFLIDPKKTSQKAQHNFGIMPKILSYTQVIFLKYYGGLMVKLKV